MGERAITIAAKLYEHRKAMRFLHGDAYPARVAEMRPYLQTIMSEKGTSEMGAALALAKHCIERPYTVSLIMATALEMMEPTPPSTDGAEQ